MNKVTVALEQRSYDILIGANSLQYLHEFLAQKNYSKIFIITDENVAKLHLASLHSVLSQSKIIAEKIILPAGEQTKSFNFLEKICEIILLLPKPRFG